MALALGIGIVLYIYVGYPFILWMVTRWVNRPWIRDESLYPTISVILPVYNGREHIKARLANILDARYDPHNVEVIVASDGSTDGTEEIVAQIGDPRIKVVHLAVRSGKTAAINRALELARGDILIFTDLHTRMDIDSLQKLVRNFADHAVGAASGQDHTLIDSASRTGRGEGAYVRYEMAVRRLESLAGSITGVSGCLYAIRRQLARPIPQDLIDDLYLPLEVIAGGMRAVAEPEATAYVPTVCSRQEEYRRRIRTAVGGILVLWSQRRLLNPFRFGIFSLELASHKMLRFLAPLLIVGLVVGSSILWDAGALPKAILFTLCIVIVLAMTQLLPVRMSKWIPLGNLALYLVTVNLAIAIAWFQVFRGERYTVWEPSKRKDQSLSPSPT